MHFVCVEVSVENLEQNVLGFIQGHNDRQRICENGRCLWT